MGAGQSGKIIWNFGLLWARGRDFGTRFLPGAGVKELPINGHDLATSLSEKIPFTRAMTIQIGYDDFIAPFQSP
jgi:hypothetical protein